MLGAEFKFILKPSRLRQILLLFLLSALACSTPKIEEPCKGPLILLDLNEGDKQPEWYCEGNIPPATQTAAAAPPIIPTSIPEPTPTDTENIEQPGPEVNTLEITEATYPTTVPDNSPGTPITEKSSFEIALDILSKQRDILFASAESDVLEMLDRVKNYKPSDEEIQQTTSNYFRLFDGLAITNLREATRVAEPILSTQVDGEHSQLQDMLNLSSTLRQFFCESACRTINIISIIDHRRDRENGEFRGSHTPTPNGGILQLDIFNEEVVSNRRIDYYHFVLQIHEIMHAALQINDITQPVFQNNYHELQSDFGINKDNILAITLLYNAIALETPNMDTIENEGIYYFSNEYCKEVLSTLECSQEITGRALWGHIPEEFLTSISSFVLANSMTDLYPSYLEENSEYESSVRTIVDTLDVRLRDFAKFNLVAARVGHNNLTYSLNENSYGLETSIELDGWQIAYAEIDNNGNLLIFGLTNQGESAYWQLVNDLNALLKGVQIQTN